jgi:hypothetical protein
LICSGRVAPKLCAALNKKIILTIEN